MVEDRKIRIRILFGPEIALGPGKAALLDAIAETGSISGAARRMGMSYRRAWMLVDTMNRCFKKPLVAAETGGKGGGGASVTGFGQEVLARYHDMEQRAIAGIETDIAAFTELLAESDDGADVG